MIEPAGESSDSGATAFGGDVRQSAGGDVAGRDLTKIDQRRVTHVAQQVVQQAVPGRENLHQLPAAASDFTDREEVLAEILKACRPQSYGSAGVVVGISGGPGVGKSALAIRAAHALRPDYPDAQLYVNLGGADPVTAQDPNDVLAGFLHALGVPVEQMPSTIDERANWYRSELGSRRALIVLDNARDEAQVRQLLPGAGTSVAVVTSRAVLATLEGIQSHTLRRFDRDASLELLGKLVGQARVEKEQDHADRIAQMCGDLPLAIRISGALLVKRPSWSLAALSARLSSERTRLSQLESGGLSVRAAFALSYDQLAQEQQALLGRLSVVPGQDFTASLAAAIIETDPQVADLLLHELLDAQLVESPTYGRFAVHDLLRLYARERLESEEDGAAVEQVHHLVADWYVALVVGAAQSLDTPGRDPTETQALVDLAEMELDNLLAACRAAFSRGAWQMAIRLALRASGLIVFERQGVTGEQLARVGLEAERHLDGPRLRAELYSELGSSLTIQNRWEEATDAYLTALKICEELGARGTANQVMNNLATVYAEQSRWDEAIATLDEVLNYFRETGHRLHEAQALNNQGIAYRRRGDLDKAVAHYEEALEIWRAAGMAHKEAITLNNVGVIYGQLGKWEQAIAAHTSSLEMLRSLGDRQGEARNLNNLGIIYAKQERWVEAIDAFEQDLSICRSLENRHGEGKALNNLGIAYMNGGKITEAIAAYEADVAICRALGDRYGEAQTLNNMATAHMERGDLQEAKSRLEAALELYREFGDTAHAGTARVNLAEVERRLLER